MNQFESASRRAAAHAVWSYAPMEDGRAYQNHSPYDGTLVHAFLEPVGSKLRE